MIVSAYAQPAYRSIDPTAAGALFFLICFGMMFADLGHGAVIALLGIFFLAAGRGAIREAGKLMAFCGAAASVFGVLFGSFFGREDVIPPVLFHPAAHIGTFLSLGIATGITVISTGILLNILKLFRRGDAAEAVFSQWGILSLVFYWLCAAIITLSAAGIVTLSFTTVLAAAATPLALIAAGEAVTALIKGKTDMQEIIFHPVEIILSLLSNTVSFVRVAAFGLCHIALMSAVYIVAGAGDSEAYRVSVSIEGNIMVIVLELIVVTIQCLRLQYYEFYSKFFGDPGRAFIPLRTPHAREGA
jgi:V/A-type H+-transporting ATPase subunit I